jgi:hypothetical protein
MLLYFVGDFKYSHLSFVRSTRQSRKHKLSRKLLYTHGKFPTPRGFGEMRQNTANLMQDERGTTSIYLILGREWPPRLRQKYMLGAAMQRPNQRPFLLAKCRW